MYKQSVIKWQISLKEFDNLCVAFSHCFCRSKLFARINGILEGGGGLLVNRILALKYNR